MRRRRLLRIEWAAEDTVATLEKRYRREADAQRAQQLRALRLIRGGETLRATAALVAAAHRRASRRLC